MVASYGIPFLTIIIRAIPELSKFKLAISDLKFDTDCCTFCSSSYEILS